MTKNNRSKDNIGKAKKLPVKPTLIVKGSKDLESLWKVVKHVLSKPKIDSIKKNK
jgi:uncharacterized membrane protein